MLEIGTGTGLTGALLAELTGCSGHVVSVDIDANLIQRADELHAERGLRNVTLIAGHGGKGGPGHGPYDVIIAWTTPAVIPQSWLDQARPGATICTPVYVAPVSRTSAHICGTVTPGRRLVGIRLGEASYVDMGGTVNEDFRVPMLFVDAVRDCGGRPAWISVAWRDRHPGHDPRHALEMLTGPGHREQRDLAPNPTGHHRAWRDFRAYCAALDHGTNLTSHGTADGDNAIGFSSGDNAAVLTDTGVLLASTAASPALSKLRSRLDGWEKAGRVSSADLAATAVSLEDGEAVRLALPVTLE